MSLSQSKKAALAHRLKTADRFKSIAKRAAKFTSGPWGTNVGFGLILFWLGAAIVIGWNEAYGIVDEVVTMSSFLLLFLLQRAQAKDTLAMQVKLNELLAAVNKASPTLINLEDRPRPRSARSMTSIRSLRSRGTARSIEEARN